MNQRRIAFFLAVTTVAITTWGCSNTPTLVSTPNLYADSTESPYDDVPPELQSTSMKVLYATDRQSEMTKTGIAYNTKRSHALAYGICHITIGGEATWEELVAASTTHDRAIKVPLAMTSIEQLGQVPPIGPMLQVDGQWVEDPAYLSALEDTEAHVHSLLAEQLALTPTKEVFLFVHGYNNTFEAAAFRIAQVWHFMGRVGVPLVYSWPAGSGGLLRGYTTDYESGEFTNTHLKQILKAIASCPEVEKVNLISHSRGTDVLATALKELHIEYRAAGKDTRTELKLSQLILAAPDMDLDVVMERFTAERMGFVPERLTLYVSPNDKAVGLSAWLFGGTRRMGQLQFGDLGENIGQFIKHHPIMSIVDVRADTGFLGHGYFSSNPAVLSDVILVLRDKRAPGAEHGRPLIDAESGFWELYDGYPFAGPHAESEGE